MSNTFKYQSIPSDEDEDASSLLTNDSIHPQRKYIYHANVHQLAVASIGIFTALFIFVHIWNPFTSNNFSNIMSASLVKSIPFKQISHPEPPTAFWGNVVKPYPTGAFWTNLAIKSGDYPAAVLPYGVKCLPDGVQISYGPWRRFISQVFVQDVFAADIQISSYQTYISRSIENYDNFSVGMSYKTTSLGKYKAVLVKGSPFITIVYENATPVITTTIAKIISAEFRPVRSTNGVQYLVTLSNNQKWLVYCTETVYPTIKDNTMTWPYPIKGFVRVAFLPPQNADAAFAVLMNYVQRYPTGGTVQISYPAGNIALLTYQWTSVGTGPLLMLALPHHNQLLVSPPESEDSKRLVASLTPIYSMKGKMKPVIGDVWKLQYALPQIGWNYVLSNKLSTSQLDDIARQLQRDVKIDLPSSTDPYGFGKEVARLARLALIADELGIADARSTALIAIEAAILPWLTGDNADYFQYDRTYGGILPLAGLSNQFADYGAGYYSDHHFHYGYFVYVGAVLSRLDAPFADAHRAAFDSFLRDYCNHDSTDTDFPVSRHKDFYDGHSWASGLLIQANGKGQESSSESVNAYYAAYLYGLQTNNIDLMRFAQTMLAMEVQAVNNYWHMPTEGDIYDALFASNKVVGNMGAFDATCTTWFGSNPEYVHGINVMPITPATALLLDSNFVQQEWPVITTSALDSMEDEWKYIALAVYAVVDREDAWRRLMSLSTFGPGGSRTNALFWAASRAPPVAGFNSSSKATNPYVNVKSTCASNSACDANGILGECCPVPGGYNMGCCGRLVNANVTQREIEWGYGRRR